MNRSIVRELVAKDLAIMKVPALCYLSGGIAALIFTLLAAGSGWLYWLFGQVMFISVMLGAGVHAAVMTVVEERRERNLAFVMSLPVTILDYTAAKIIANVMLAGGVWLILSASSYLVFVRGILPIGSIPFVTIALVSILVAYLVILSAALIFESQAAAIIAIIGMNLSVPMALWWFVDLYGVRATVNGSSVVWNGTYLSALALECAALIGLAGVTLWAQSRKTVFL